MPGFFGFDRALTVCTGRGGVGPCSRCRSEAWRSGVIRERSLFPESRTAILF